MKKVIKPYFERFQLIKGFFTGDKKSLKFFELHPKNDNQDDVLSKIGCINDP